MEIVNVTGVAPRPLNATGPDDRLEQAFLEEMLKYCGPQASEGSFAGGHGEEQFASFLTREYAAILADRLDFGFGEFAGEGRE